MKTFKKITISCARELTVILAGALFLILFASSSQALGQASNSMALALSWKGYADTDLKFSKFFEKDHTLVLRFMPQFPNAYEGPFVAENGSGVFMIGQDELEYLNKETTKWTTKLFLAVGSESRSYATPLKAHQWYHLAVVATTSGTKRVFTVYLDGTPLSPSLRVAADDAQMPDGVLRFGKRTTGQTVNGHNAQFYGLLDDIAVFKRALSPSEIQNLNSNVLQLTGDEKHLLAGYTFNQGKLPDELDQKVTLKDGAERVAVSTKRDSDADKERLPLPTQHVEMSLPFQPGEAWYVVQGYDNPPGHHAGYASFTWDFIVADQPHYSEYPSGSGGAPLYATAPGKVVGVEENKQCGQNKPNIIDIEQADDEIAIYLHLRQNSAEVKVNDKVKPGQKVALLGDTGMGCCGSNHLHFGVADMKDGTPSFVTFPIAFSNYEVRDEKGNWNFVARGIPQAGEVIRARSHSEGWRLHSLQTYVLNNQVLYNAVWRTGTSPEIQIYGWKYKDYRKKYDELWPEGWRLHILQAYVLNNEVLYNAVWRPGTSPEYQIYGATYKEYRKRYDELWPEGWRLYILQAYVLNDQVLYNAVWRPNISPEYQLYGATFQEYKKRYEELYPKEWRIHISQSYVLNNRVLYNAVWRPCANLPEHQIDGVAYKTYRKTYDELWPQGWRLHLLQSYVLNNQVLYNAVWRLGSSSESHSPEIQVYGWKYKDYRKKYDELWNQGLRRQMLDTNDDEAEKQDDELEVTEATVPTEVALHQNHPNPFSASGTFGNPSTNFSFSLPQKAHVTLKIFNVIGEEVATLVNEPRRAGTHTVVFEATALPSGVYFSVLKAGDVRQVRRILLMK